jgi:prevent-host-death family protein
LVESLEWKELRQHAGTYVERAEAGETMLITVAGHPSAILGPAGRKTWRPFDEVAEIFATETDPSSIDDVGQLNASISDPWETE